MPREWQKRKKLLLRRRRSSTSLRLLHEGLEKIKNVEGARLKAFIKCIAEQDVPDINVGNISSRTSQIALCDFRAFLNGAMRLVESKNAKVLRQIKT